MRFADLHLHTLFSDGTYSPEELIRASKGLGLEAIAVVDHDTIEGIEPAVKSGRQAGIEVLPGIELSAEYEGLEVHILGYLMDYGNKMLLEKLDFLKKNRIERIHKIVKKLQKMGVALEPEAVFAISGGGTVGRLHVARAMVSGGHISSTFEAFQKYIGDKCPAYVLGFKLLPEQAIKLIRDAAGVAVLAHPYVLNRDELIAKFLDYGLQGLEAYYPEHSPSQTKTYLSLAKKYNLLVTGGSDCHGDAKPGVKIGAVKIPYELVEKLKQARGMSR